jgi:hypothetical protein
MYTLFTQIYKRNQVTGRKNQEEKEKKEDLA